MAVNGGYVHTIPDKKAFWYSMNSNGTELEQVVHAHQTSCLTGWPRGFSELNARSSLNISFRLSWSQSSFLVYTTPKCGTVPIRYVTLHVLPSAFIQVILKQWTSLACMFCFPNTGHVIILQGTVSFTFRLRIIYETTMGQVPLGPLLGKQNTQGLEVY